jgi:zinc protease
MKPTTTHFSLSNGLLVILKEIHTAPLISQWIWYRVGSRNERPGGLGISHWVEHMQFKGTECFPSGILDKAISRDGGVWNAFTYLDWTAYFETVPAEKIDLVLQLEADRMVNSLFNPDEVEAERTVIISERQGNENEPTFLLSEQVQAAAFQIHPYRNQVIGDSVDLQMIQADDLYQHYRKYYLPNNAVLTIAGDFDTPVMLERVRQLYEPIPASALPQLEVAVEPRQEKERKVELKGPGDTTYLQVAYHVPRTIHPDFLALNVIDSLLSGPSDLSVFGGGLSNKTSRLYRSLVEGELTESIFGDLQATIDPHLYILSMVVHPDRSSEAVIDALDQEISRLQQTPPTIAEVERAVKQARALFAYNSESITNQAAWLGFAEMFAGQDWLDGYLDHLALVTPERIQQAVQTYLIPENRVVGVYQPEEGNL